MAQVRPFDPNPIEYVAYEFLHNFEILADFVVLIAIEFVPLYLEELLARTHCDPNPKDTDN